MRCVRLDRAYSTATVRVATASPQATIASTAAGKAVAAHEQRDEHLFEHLVLSDDDAPDLLDDAALGFLEAQDARPQFR